MDPFLTANTCKSHPDLFFYPTRPPRNASLLDFFAHRPGIRLDWITMVLGSNSVSVSATVDPVAQVGCPIALESHVQKNKGMVSWINRGNASDYR